ncbi:MAG: hypothetical protein DMG22_02030 [Acidobacteria bacterium]|nr:MAG: hypothetical protein DMG22_02030 [Acidobacteriota bacterium]
MIEKNFPGRLLKRILAMSFWAPFASLRASSSLVILSEAKNPFHSALRVNFAKNLRSFFST